MLDRTLFEDAIATIEQAPIADELALYTSNDSIYIDNDKVTIELQK